MHGFSGESFADLEITEEKKKKKKRGKKSFPLVHYYYHYDVIETVDPNGSPTHPFQHWHKTFGKVTILEDDPGAVLHPLVYEILGNHFLPLTQ